MDLSVTQRPSEMPEEYLLGQFIPLHYHFNMLRDDSRTIPFRDAINLVVPDGSVVAELGGGTGILSWFAAQKARHVYCVERNPALVRSARDFLRSNHRGECVEVIHSDAMLWLPPEPVDVVICEMLHVGLIREKQLAVIQSFKDRYQRRFGHLPQFIPDTTVLAMQAIQQDHCFHGYRAPVPIFEVAGPHLSHQWLSEPHFYSTIEYGTSYSMEFSVDAELAIQSDGELNAISLLTNNFLAFLLHEGRAIQWLMNQLTLPLPESLSVMAGDRVSIRIAYEAGCSLEEIRSSISVKTCSRKALSSGEGRLRRSA